MTTLTADQILDSWRNYPQIRSAFGTLANYQDYVLRPSASSLKVIENNAGKIVVVPNETLQTKKQLRHKFL